jgi:hypothetical protein
MSMSRKGTIPELGIDTGTRCDLSLFVMALLHEAVGSKKFDTRMIERNIARGVLSSQEHAENVAQLPDDAENAEWISVDSFIEEEPGEPKDAIMNGNAIGHSH